MAEHKYGRIGYLDALRGLAACSVVLYHMVMLAHIDDVISPWQKYLSHIGETGVPLFFTVSAFSLFYAFSKQKSSPHAVFEFYLRRFFRIAPLFYAVSAAIIVFLWPAWPPLKVLLPDMLFYFNFVAGRQISNVPAGWTIGVEMFFYLIFPIVFLFSTSLLRSILLFFIASALSVVAWFALPFLVADPAGFYKYFVFRHLPIFASGVVAYYAVLHFKTAGRKMHGVFLLLVFAAGFALHRAGLFGAYYNYAIGPIFAILLIALSGWSPLLIVNGATKFLGKISYSIYLIHATIINLTLPLYSAIYSCPVDQNLKFAAVSAMTFGIVLPLSWITYNLIEQPGIGLGRAIQDRLRSGSASTGTHQQVISPAG